MPYPVIKRVKGNSYLYLQESYREGGKVKTRSRYVGRVDGSTGEIQTTDKSDPKAVSHIQKEMRNRFFFALEDRGTQDTLKETPARKLDSKPTEEDTEGEKDPQKTKTPDNKEKPRKTPIKRLDKALSLQTDRIQTDIKLDTDRLKISRFSMQQDAKHFGKVLESHGIAPNQMPSVTVRQAGFITSISSLFSSGYRVTAGTGKGEREKFRDTYRQTLARATLDTLRHHRPEAFAGLSLRFNDSFRATNSLIMSFYRNTEDKNRFYKVLGLYFFGVVAKVAGGKMEAEKLGLLDYGERKNWEDEAVSLLVEMRKKGAKRIKQDAIKEKNKARIAQRKTINERKGFFWGGRKKRAIERAKIRQNLQEEKLNKILYLEKHLNLSD